MANVNEQAVWVENINLIAEDDPVQGGENGIDNIPHQQLANRTAFLKSEIDGAKGQIPKGETVSLASLYQMIKDLQQIPAPTITQYMIPVGGLFETTKSYASGTALAQDMGYGSWEYFGDGRVTVAATRTPIDDGSGSTISLDMGTTGGVSKHTLSVDEMPSHNHSPNNVFNKFTGKYSDFVAAGWNTSALDDGANTTGSRSDDNSNDELVIAGSDLTLNRMTEQAVGGNKPHNNMQPYIVVGRWVRTA